MAPQVGVLPAAPSARLRVPLAHCHVNGEFSDAAVADDLDKMPSRLHIPTVRMPLEVVLWHVITEWGVRSKTEHWRELLVESLGGFEERRRAT